MEGFNEYITLVHTVMLNELCVKIEHAYTQFLELN